MRRTLLPSIAALVVLGCRSPSPVVATSDPPSVHVVPTHIAHDPELLRTLAILATGGLPAIAEIEDARRKLDAGQLTMSRYIDSLLASPTFAQKVAPIIIFRSLLDTVNASSGFPLKHTDDPSPIYYLHTPCKPAKAVAVRPWWSLDHDVKICADSYKPDKWLADRSKTNKSEPELSCLSDLGYDQSCGCGPNLIRCYPSKEHYQQLKQSMQNELRQTVGYLVSRGKPIDTMFLSNETWRNRDVEAFQRGQIVEARKMTNLEALLRDLDAWPAEGKWAAREDLAPGQHAGLLTAPQMVFYFPDRRQRMTAIYDVLWCDEPNSAGATPELVTKIAGAHGDFQLKQDHWKDLAARPICTNCHARLDYGLQFFHGFGNTSVMSYFSPALQYTDRGQLYGQNIDDPRGDGDLTPQGFARLAIAQPEYARCMARDFGEYVLGGRTTQDHIDKLAAQFKPGETTAQQLMRAALLQMVDEWPRFETGPAQPRVPPASASSNGNIAEIHVSPAVRHALDEHCMDCHDGTPTVPDFSKAMLPRAMVVSMLDAVAFGIMPEKRPLPTADRAALIEPLIESAWSGQDAAAARDYYLGRMTSLSAYRPEVIFSLVKDRARAERSSDWRMMERSVRPDAVQASPGLITEVGLETIDACKQHNKTRAEIDACISATLRVEDIVVDHR